MTIGKHKLTKKQQELIRCIKELGHNGNVYELSRLSNVSIPQIYLLLNDPQFLAHLRIDAKAILEGTRTKRTSKLCELAEEGNPKALELSLKADGSLLPDNANITNNNTLNLIQIRADFESGKQVSLPDVLQGIPHAEVVSDRVSIEPTVIYPKGYTPEALPEGDPDPKPRGKVNQRIWAYRHRTTTAAYKAKQKELTGVGAEADGGERVDRVSDPSQ